MRIAVLGAGFTGLTAAYRLLQKGHQVSVFEKESQAGGLASGFKLPGWDWPLEESYHHFFADDRIAFSLIKELGLSDKLFFKKPITAVYYHGSIKPLDTPLNLLRFPYLPPLDRLRTGMILAYLKALFKGCPFWKRLEGQTAEEFLTRTMGRRSYQVIWEPLLKSKFGQYASSILASWFWARIKKRSKKLGYLEGGFQVLCDKLVEKIKELGGKVYLGTKINKLEKQRNSWKLETENSLEIRNSKLEIIISSLPTPEFLKIFSPKPLKPLKSLKSLSSLRHLTTQILILELKEPFFPKSLPVYWLNINDTSSPFLILAEHTNFVDPKYYGGHHLLYVGNYLPPGHPYLKKSKEELLELFLPYLKKINPLFSQDLRTIPGIERRKFRELALARREYVSPVSINCSVLSAQSFILPFSQPVVTKNYPAIINLILNNYYLILPGLYFANQDLIYPWDRGVNYAIDLGERVAKALQLS